MSHALSRLAHAGLVTGHGDEWHLHGTLESQLATMIEPDGGRVGAARVGGGRPQGR